MGLVPIINMNFDLLLINVTLPNSSSNTIGIQNSEISFIGKKEDLPKNYTSKKNIDCKNYLVTPGLIDCHTHLLFAGNRANEFTMRQQGATYAEIANMGGGILSTVNATRKATEEELYTTGKQRIEQLIKDGVTTVEIKSGYGLDFDSEIKLLQVATKLKSNLPIKIVRTFLGAHVCPPEFTKKNEYISFLCEKVLPEIKKRNLADTVDGFCESIAFSNHQLDMYFTRAKELGFAIKIHAEQLTNSKSCLLAEKYNAISADHLDYANEEDIKTLAKAKTVAVLLPGASYFLHEKQKPPIEFLRKYHVPIGIATDLNPGTSPINSLLVVMNLAQVIFSLTPEEIIKAVTENAAKALGLEKLTGNIEVTKNADIVIWEAKNIEEIMYGINLPINKIVISSGEIIYDTITQGKII